MRTNIYKQLNQKERETIYQLKKRGLTNSDIAQKLGRDYFEVTREKDTIVFKPKVLMDKTIQKRLEKAEKAYKKGKYKGPFKSASAVLLAVKQSRHEGHSH